MKVEESDLKVNDTIFSLVAPNRGIGTIREMIYDNGSYRYLVRWPVGDIWTRRRWIEKVEMPTKKEI